MSEADYKLAKEIQDMFRTAIEHCMAGNVDKLRETMEGFVREHQECSMKDLVCGFHTEGKTLFHLASNSGKIEVLKLLLEYHNNDQKNLVNLKDNRGFTPLMNATISESKDCMELLLSLGANVSERNNDNATCLHFAAADPNLERVRLLCEHVTARDLRSILNQQSSAGSVLHWAAAKGHTDVLLYLAEQGADINLGNISGIAPVTMAAAAGHESAVVALLEAGADISGQIRDGLSLLHVLAEQNMCRAVTLLINNHPQQAPILANAFSEENFLPIHLTTSASIVRLLLPLSTSCVVPEEVRRESETEQIEYVLQETQQRLHRWHQQHPQEKSSEVTENSAQSRVYSSSMEYFESLSSSGDSVAAETAKAAGNAAFTAKNYAEALEQYTIALSHDKDNAVLWSNRSACLLQLSGRERDALRDAEICRHLKPLWTKGCYRLAAARLALEMFEDAAVAAFEGCKLDPQNKELKEVVERAVHLGRQAHQKQQQQQQQLSRSCR
jgi:ankyrin repeat protein